MPKYANYAELAAAFKSGELGKGYYLMLDKRGTENCLCFHDESLSDEENDEKSDECSDLFTQPDDMLEVFTSMGIPSKWC